MYYMPLRYIGVSRFVKWSAGNTSNDFARLPHSLKITNEKEKGAFFVRAKPTPAVAKEKMVLSEIRFWEKRRREKQERERARVSEMSFLTPSHSFFPFFLLPFFSGRNHLWKSYLPPVLHLWWHARHPPRVARKTFPTAYIKPWSKETFAILGELWIEMSKVTLKSKKRIYSKLFSTGTLPRCLAVAVGEDHAENLFSAAQQMTLPTNEQL